MSNAYRDAVLADSPFTYFRCGEASGSLADSSGHGLGPLAPSNAPTYGAPSLIATDAANLAVQLLGSSSQLFTGDVTGAYVAGDLTVEAWITSTTTGTGRWLSNGFLAGWSVGASDSATYRFTTLGVQDFDFGVGPGAGGVTHHVVYVYDDTAKTCSLYVDGAFVSTLGPAASGMTYGASQYWLGARFNTEFWTGEVDEVATYLGKLSAARILAHFNAATTGGGPGAGVNIPLLGAG